MLIDTHRFILRPLSVADVSTRYVSWLYDKCALRFINGATGDNHLDELKNYVAQREGRDDVVFLGIFTHAGEHIGNIKYEPVHTVCGVAVMGVLIGEVAWRGKGVAGEVIQASAKWLNENRGVSLIALGVDRNNLPGIRAYEKLGFVDEDCDLVTVDPVVSRVMVWHLSKGLC